MATELERVIDNFEYWVTGSRLTPTSQLKRTPFKVFDPVSDDLSGGSGGLRAFWVEWRGSGADTDATDRTAREAVHEFRLHVVYPVVMRFSELMTMVLQDRHDLIKKLRDPQYWKGYSGSEAADVGIMLRQRLADSLDMSDPKIWKLDIRWAVKVRETE